MSRDIDLIASVAGKIHMTDFVSNASFSVFIVRPAPLYSVWDWMLKVTFSCPRAAYVHPDVRVHS